MYIKIVNPEPIGGRKDEAFFIKVSEIESFDVMEYPTQSCGMWHKLIIRTKHGLSTTIRDNDRMFINRIIDAITKEEGCTSLQKSE